MNLNNFDNQNRHNDLFKVAVNKLSFVLEFRNVNGLSEKLLNWKDDIETKQIIAIDDIDDLNGIHEFFRCVANNSLPKKDHLKTYCILSLQSNYCNDNNLIERISGGNTHDILTFYIEAQISRRFHDLSGIEDILSERYEEILQYENEMLRINMNNHHRILSKAISHYNEDFPYSKFIEFIINTFERQRDIIELFRHFHLYDFNEKEIEILYKTLNIDDRYFNIDSYELSTLYQEKKRIEIENSRLKSENEELNNMKEQITSILGNLDSIDNKMNEHEKLMNTYKTNLDEIFNEIKNQIPKFDDITTMISSKLLDTVNSIKHDQDEMKRELKSNIDSIDNKMNEQNTQLGNIMDNSLNSKNNTDNLEKMIQDMKKENETNMNQSKQSILNQISSSQEHIFNYIDNANSISKYEHRRDNQFDGIFNNTKINGSVRITTPAKIWLDYVTNLIEYSNASYFSTWNTDANTNWIEILKSKISLFNYHHMK